MYSTETGLRKYENVVLRYYSTGIVKIAIYKGLLDRSITKQIEPPYVYDPQCLPLYKDALGAERMGGYEAIDYDLARYVLVIVSMIILDQIISQKIILHKLLKFIEKI